MRLSTHLRTKRLAARAKRLAANGRRRAAFRRWTDDFFRRINTMGDPGWRPDSLLRDR